MKCFNFTIMLLPALYCFSACNQENKYHYAIKDFRKALQPTLEAITTKGIVTYDSSVNFLEVNGNNKELEHLSYSEHPVLRAAALRLLTERDTVDNFNLVMSHLDDTAVVPVDRGEFGIDLFTVTDDLIQHSIWKTQAQKDITVDSVIMHHNNLQSGYYILRRLKPEAKYYPFIKKMVLRKKEEYLARDHFWMLEEAAYKLAAYKRLEDVSLIKEVLMRNISKMSTISFELMREYPDTAYLEVLDEYSYRAMYRAIRDNRRYDETGEFIHTVATYKHEKSAQILSRILNRKPLLPPYLDSAYIINDVSFAIWNNMCPAYKNLEKHVTPYIVAHAADTTNFIFDAPQMPVMYPKIRW